MLPRRVELQLAAARAAPPRTLLGCRFVRDPPDATWHYSLWANTTTQHDLWLQQFRECTVVQPTWFYRRSLWSDLGAPPSATPPPHTRAPGMCPRSILIAVPAFDHPFVRVSQCITLYANLYASVRARPASTRPLAISARTDSCHTATCAVDCRPLFVRVATRARAMQGASL